MKLNLTVRMRNPWFWISLTGVILTAMGQSPENFTSWASILIALTELLQNPYQLGCVTLAVLGVFIDPTTEGVCDSRQALGYQKPKGDL